MWWIHSSIAFIPVLHSFQYCIHSVAFIPALYSFQYGIHSIAFIPLHQSWVHSTHTRHPIPMQHWEEVETEVRMWGKLPPNQATTIRSCHLGSFHCSPPTNGCNQPTQQPTSDLIISNHFKLCNSSDFFLDAFPIPIRLHSQAEAKQLKCSFMSRVLTVMFWDPQCTAAPYDPCLDQGYWLQWE